jgi:hypothetical protein
MLRHLTRRVSVDCDRAGLTQRLGRVVPRERIVQSSKDTLRADRASVSRVFSCEGHGLGDKASLNQLLHNITSILLAALHNCPFGPVQHI